MSIKVKNQMSEIMTAAWSFVRKNGYTMAEALKCAWANFKLRKAMATKISVSIFVRLTDQSERLLVHLQKTSYHLHRAATASVMRPVKPTMTPRKRLGGALRKQT